MIFPAVAEKRANNFRGLLFAAPGIIDIVCKAKMRLRFFCQTSVRVNKTWTDSLETDVEGTIDRGQILHINLNRTSLQLLLNQYDT